jgi:acyl carrier protein
MNDGAVRKVVRDHLLEALAEVQQQSCRDVPTMSAATVPLTDIPGFDSLCGVEAVVLLEERLGIEIEELPFTDPLDYRQLGVEEIVDFILSRYGERISVRAATVQKGA